MTQLEPPESTSNYRAETELPSLVKRGRLWIPESAQRRSRIQKVWGWTGFGEKKLWDVLQLLIVPTALAIGAFYLQETAKQRDFKIADDRAKQETLNRYFDQISTLLFERKLRSAKPGDEARIVARARTLSALKELDGKRKGQLISFLSEARLIKRIPVTFVQGRLNRDRVQLRSIVDLTNADLSQADISRVDLWEANLAGANLRGADIRSASLGYTNLQADLTGANLSGSDLEGANLVGARLNGANLIGIYMSETNFYSADLRGAAFGFSPTFEKAFFCQTIMPDGTTSNRDCDKLNQK